MIIQLEEPSWDDQTSLHHLKTNDQYKMFLRWIFLQGTALVLGGTVEDYELSLLKS